ncbi:hypothetical protein SORBI_3002G215866 [Sorghum bicolor]|uniref:Uncharacterized protein n=1 Tax=Sorghum bicolor TaxID=4558 RepID=A0A1W0W5E7_SORBI|nr:hypothetical protein SORBI_3002G215866 [Sorghum bicolor]
MFFPTNLILDQSRLVIGEPARFSPFYGPAQRAHMLWQILILKQARQPAATDRPLPDHFSGRPATGTSSTVVTSRTSTREHAVPSVRQRPGGRAGRPAEEEEEADGRGAPRRRGLLFALGRIVLPRLRLRALLLRSRRALARLRNYYADVMKGLIADAAAAEPAKAGTRVVEARAAAGTGETLVRAGRPAAVVVPAAVAGAVLRCNSHYYVR